VQEGLLNLPHLLDQLKLEAFQHFLQLHQLVVVAEEVVVLLVVLKKVVMVVEAVLIFQVIIHQDQEMNLLLVHLKEIQVVLENHLNKQVAAEV
jgi:hypothetical protein